MSHVMTALRLFHPDGVTALRNVMTGRALPRFGVSPEADHKDHGDDQADRAERREQGANPAEHEEACERHC